MAFRLLKTYHIPDEMLSAIIRIFDSNIQSIQMLDEHNYRVNICNQEKASVGQGTSIYVVQRNDKRYHPLHIGCSFSQQGFDLLIDEAEAHFHKTLVENMLSLYMDKTVNRHGATLLFSTHYCEVLDLFNRQDNIWVCQSSDKIAIKNMYECFEVRSGLLKSKRFL